MSCVITRAALKALARFNEYRYEQMFRKEDEAHVPIIPLAGQNDERLNRTLDGLIADTFRDPNLLAFMKTPCAESRNAGLIK